MAIDIKTQNRSYRRGLVLGLTMAEIVVLIIFALLLAVATIIKVKDDRITELERTAEEYKTQVAAITEKVNLLLDPLGKENKFDDLFRELQLAKDRAAKMEQLEQRIAELEARDRVFESIREWLKKSEKANAPLEEQVKWLDKQIWLANQVFKDQDTKQLFEKTLQQLQQAETRIVTLQGQLRNAQRTQEAMGKGTEHPACWASPETGKPEYIFDVTLTSRGVIIQNNLLPHRAAEQQLLPLQFMVFGEEVMLNRFLTISRPLYDWSVKHDPECRFFVRVFDATKLHEKDTYKRHVRTVGQHFYIYEVLRGQS